MTTIRTILDSNVYDLLEEDKPMIDLMLTLIRKKAMTVLMPRQVAEELNNRPRGLPDLFPTTLIGHAVARADIMRAGDMLGSGDVYEAHKGNSNKDADAFIVDVAAVAADWFVTEDRRSLHRFPKIARCISMDYSAFTEKLRTLAG
jgi:hypothetical protein